MKKITFVLTLLFVGSLSVFAQKPAAKKDTVSKKIANQTVSPAMEREKFDPARNAAQDLQATVAQTEKSGKRIVLDIGGEWCVWCRNMDYFFLQNAGLAKLRDENFVWLKINFSEENENKAFLANYPEIKGYPHLYILDADGKFLYSKDTSALEQEKSYNLQRFTDFLKEWSPEKKVENK